LIEQRGELKVDFLITPTSPDLIELVGTADNRPERIHSIELGYLFEIPALDGILDLRVFHNEVDYLLNSALDFGIPDAPLRIMDAGSLRTTGAEVQADLRISRNNRLHLAYAYAHGDGARIEEIDADGEPIPNPGVNPRPNNPAVPEHTLTAMLTHRLPDDWRLSGIYYHVSEMVWLGEGDKVDRQSRLDAKISKRFRQEGGDIELSVTVQNLLDDPYWEFTTPDPDVGVRGNLSERRVYAQVKFNFR
jgi:outer membrane receptor protein involved in Fe transport